MKCVQSSDISNVELAKSSTVCVVKSGQSEKLTTFCQLYGAHCVGCSYLKVESVSKVEPSKKQQLKGFVKSVQFF